MPDPRGHASRTPPPRSPGGGEAAVEREWSDLRSRWSDDTAHRAFLDRHGDLEGLAEVGGRYRAAAEADPTDPVARRWRDEVVKRATVLAMSQLPRTQPPRAVLGTNARRWGMFLAGTWAAAALLWLLGHRLGWIR